MRNRIIHEDLEEIFSRKAGWERLRKKTLLITGAYGMLASYLVFYCIYLNEVWNYDITLILAVRNLKKLERRFGEYAKKKYIIGYCKDINEPISLEEPVDYIIHGASLASSQYYSSIPIEVILPNILGTLRLLEFAEKKNVKGFLLFSSGEIYGKVDDTISIITEQSMGISDPLNIRNCYCESKRMAEMLCYAWHWQKQIPIKIARICHTYGPTIDIENDTRVFSAFVNDIIHNRNIVMNSDGSAKRPFCYLADATAGFLQILLDGVEGEAYNLCNSDEFLSISELAEILVGLYPQQNLKVERRILPGKDKILQKIESEAAFSNSKLKELGWLCKYDTETGFRRTIESILQRQERLL